MTLTWGGGPRKANQVGSNPWEALLTHGKMVA